MKVLIIEETLSHYNDPIFQLINEKHDLTFAYILKSEVKKANYKTFQFPQKKLRRFIWLKDLRKVLNQYEVVIFVPHLKLFNLVLLPFLPRKFKLISWSIGLYITYNRKYNLNKKPDFLDVIYECIQDHCDACIFYMPQPIDFWVKHKNIDSRKYFVAHNTVKVADFGELPPFKNRDKFLFVGTLYKQKGIGELLNAYMCAKSKCQQIPPLTIVGNGPEESLIRKQIKDLGLEESVQLAGAIYDEDILKNYFLSSILCISPCQAGLSVQKSLGYGTPFVTRPDSITGGERYDIIDGETGFFYKTTDNLSELLLYSVAHPEEIEKISLKARQYYLDNASPERMAKGVLDAISFALK